MKKVLFILCACLFGALGGVKAYTVDDLKRAGWTLAAGISNNANSSDYVANFVYVLVDAGSKECVMSGQTKKHIWCDNYTPTYQILQNPFTNKSEVWTLEVRSDGFAMCNVESKDYYNSTDNNHDKNGCWNYMATNEYTNGSLTFNNLSNGKYNISGVQVVGGGYVGPWDGTVSENMATAANKSGDAAPGFDIYRMPKATYALKYLQQCPNLTATESSPIDVSYLIANPTIYQGGAATDEPWGWSSYGGHVTDDNKFTEGTGNTKLRAHKKEKNDYQFDFDYYCAISSLPGGKYKVIANGYGSPTRVKSYLYINNLNVPNSKISQELNQGSPAKDYEKSYLSVATGNDITLGIEAEGWHDGGNSGQTSEAFADDFRLQIDPYLSTMATELPGDGAMTAGLWYHFTVANTGKHVLTATNLNDIIYATGSETALSAAGSSKFEAIQTLSANTDYYVRSSSDNTLIITPCISAVATELPADGAMTADNWFYFDIATAGHYDVVASSITNIVYTTNGDLAEDASVASKFSVKNNNLSAMRYYVKSSSAQTLQWFLTDDQDYSSRMSDVAGNWTAGQGTKKEYTKDNQKGVETYNGDNNNFAAGNILYQTINDLPNGNYVVTLWAWENFAPWSKDSNPHPTGDNIAQVFANDAAYGITVIEAYDDRVWNDANKYTLNCHVTNGTLTYGVKNIATGGNWAVCRHISLTYTGPYNEIVENTETKTQTYEGTFTEDVDFTPTAECPIVDITGASFTGTLTANFTSDENGSIIATAAQKEALGSVKNVIVNGTCDNLVLTDGADFVAPSDFTANSASYSRVGIKLSKDRYATVYLPYAFSTSGLKVMEYESYEDGVLTFTPVDVTVPSTPYLVRIADGGGEEVVENYSFSGSGPVSVTDASDSYFKGTYASQILYASIDGYNYYGFSAKNGDFRQASATGNTCGAFRAYVKLPEATNARVAVRFDDGTTGIATLDADGNISGVDTQKDGKFLENGKIVIMKNGVKYDANGKKLN